MPKTYLTLKERQEAELRKFYRNQTAILRSNLEQVKKEKGLTYKDISLDKKISIGTVQKVFCPTADIGTISLDNLITVCGALGVRLTICAE